MEVGVIAIVGPTASGKTAAALAVAQRYNGEIVSADSMQIYRGMDIGTAKATPQERALVPHHMLDVAEPDQPYTTAQYAQGAGAAIADILARGKLPILCGGTGLYVEAALYEMEMGVAPDPAFRQRMEALGNAQLHDRLVQGDPISAARIHPNDRKRVIRALEIQAQTGRPASTQGQGFRQGQFPQDRSPSRCMRASASMIGSAASNKSCSAFAMTPAAISRRTWAMPNSPRLGWASGSPGTVTPRNPPRHRGTMGNNSPPKIRVNIK